MRRPDRVLADSRRWNHNIHYHPVVLAAVPEGCRRALDVGCGEGQLTRALRPRVQHVVGLDLDPASIELARAQAAPGLEYVVGDVLTYPFEAAGFDLVTSVASLHHMDAAAGLTRMADLLRPGGVLVVIGLARRRLPADLFYELAAAVGHRVHALAKPMWEHPSPKVWDPPETYAAMRRLAEDLLPGVRFRRHLLWRYSLVWAKPGAPNA
jgi:SAM-dependent methyltransferase